jgi:hypothetical protein
MVGAGISVGDCSAVGAVVVVGAVVGVLSADIAAAVSTI